MCRLKKEKRVLVKGEIPRYEVFNKCEVAIMTVSVNYTFGHQWV